MKKYQARRKAEPKPKPSSKDKKKDSIPSSSSSKKHSHDTVELEESLEDDSFCESEGNTSDESYESEEESSDYKPRCSPKSLAKNEPKSSSKSVVKSKSSISSKPEVKSDSISVTKSTAKVKPKAVPKKKNGSMATIVEAKPKSDEGSSAEMKLNQKALAQQAANALRLQRCAIENAKTSLDAKKLESVNLRAEKRMQLEHERLAAQKAKAQLKERQLQQTAEAAEARDKRKEKEQAEREKQQALKQKALDERMELRKQRQLEKEQKEQNKRIAIEAKRAEDERKKTLREQAESRMDYEAMIEADPDKLFRSDTEDDQTCSESEVGEHIQGSSIPISAADASDYTVHWMITLDRSSYEKLGKTKAEAAKSIRQMAKQYNSTLRRNWAMKWEKVHSAMFVETVSDSGKQQSAEPRVKSPSNTGKTESNPVEHKSPTYFQSLMQRLDSRMAFDEQQPIDRNSMSLAQVDMGPAAENTEGRNTSEQEYCTPVMEDITTAAPGYSDRKQLEPSIKLSGDYNRKENPQSTQSPNSRLDPASRSKSVPDANLTSLQSPNMSVANADGNAIMPNSSSNLSYNPTVSAGTTNVLTAAPNSKSTLLQMSDSPPEKAATVAELPKTNLAENPLKPEEVGDKSANSGTTSDTLQTTEAFGSHSSRHLLPLVSAVDSLQSQQQVSRPISAEQAANSQNDEEHAHMLFQYDGNRGRGAMNKVLQELEKYLNRHDIRAHLSIAHTQGSSRQHVEAKYNLQTYLMHPRKGYVDLTPACSHKWRPATKVANAQLNALMKLQRQIADRSEVVEFMRSLETTPASTEALRKAVYQDVMDHKEMYHSNRANWRRAFFSTLKSYKILNYVNRLLTKAGEWRQLELQMELEDAEATRGWKWRNFLVEGLISKCTCGNRKKARIAEAACAYDDKDFMEHGEIYGSATAAEIRNTSASLSYFQSMKRILKYKGFKDPNEQFVTRLGGHLKNLVTDDLRMARRKSNFTICSLGGDCAKTSILDAILAIFHRPGERHLILDIDPTRFGCHGASSAGLYQAVRLNDYSVTCMSESELKQICEGDYRSKQNTKGDSVQCLSSEQHAVVCCTSNLVDRKSAARAIRKTRDSSITEDGWGLIFESNGRMGIVLRNETTVPRMWMADVNRCQKCGAEFVLWLITAFETSRLLFSREEVNIDSDEEMDEQQPKVYEQSDSIEMILKKKGRRPRRNPEDETKPDVEMGTYVLSADDLALLADAKADRLSKQHCRTAGERVNPQQTVFNMSNHEENPIGSATPGQQHIFNQQQHQSVTQPTARPEDIVMQT